MTTFSPCEQIELSESPATCLPAPLSPSNTLDDDTLDDEAVTSSAELCYRKLDDGDDKVRTLLAMLVGLEYTELKVKFDEHVKAGRVTKSSIRLRGKIEYLYEIRRRGTLLEVPPRPKAWKNEKMLSWLEENPLKNEEADWVLKEYASFIAKKDEEALNDIIPGSNIRKSDRYKMRLYEAVFLDEFRDLFFKRNNSLSRVQLDARNSVEQRTISFEEKVTDKYNDASWVPNTKCFPMFHHELINSFDLPFDETCALTIEQTKRLLVEVRGRLNLVFKNWTKSGNGKLNFSEPTQKIRIRNGDEATDAADEEGLVIVDDDRWQYCQMVGMHLGYFWCLSEYHDLTDDCRQHCDKVGVTMDIIRSTSSPSLSFGSRKKTGDEVLGMMKNMQSQMHHSQMMTNYNSKKNELNDKLSMLHQQLLFSKSEKYEAEKWALKAEKAFVDAYKDLRIEKRVDPPEPEYILILEDQVAAARKSRDVAKQGILDAQASMESISSRIVVEEKEYSVFVNLEPTNLFIAEELVEDSVVNTRKKPRMAKRNIRSEDETSNEIDAIFCDNNSNIAPSNAEIVESMVDSDIID